MRIYICSLLALFFTLTVSAQDKELYRPNENAEEALGKIISQAGKENKHVLVQVGGNWCIWCRRFNHFTTTDPTIDSLIKSSFVVYHLNYSKENTNEAILAKYKFPQRFGFPVFLILDGKGNLLHTQNSEYLEDGTGYGKAKVLAFLKAWTVAALDPASYKGK